MDPFLNHSKQIITGCLLGGALGDAFASAAEHTAPAPLAPYTPDWRITDDTQLTLATCEAILARGAIDPEAIAAAMCRWFDEGRVTGVGSSTLGALRALSVGAHWALSGLSGERAAGNGAAMRCAPFAFLLGLDTFAFTERQTLRDVARITHKNDEAFAGALALLLAIQGFATRPHLAFEAILTRVIEGLFDSHTRDALQRILDEPLTSYEQVATRLGTSGFVAHSVPASIAAARQGAATQWEEMLREIVAHGGDVDTIASMAGQLVGAASGLQPLPRHLLEKIHDLADIEARVSAFAQWASMRSR